MGYTTIKHACGSYQNFQPDDTDTTFFISTEYNTPTLTEILELCNDKWGEISFDDITIEAEHIHTECLGYDVYQSGDYTDFIRITNTKK